MNTQTTKENKKAEETFVEHIDKGMLPASGSQSAVVAATMAPPQPPPPPAPPSSSSSIPNTERPAKPDGHVARHKRSGRRVRSQQKYWALVKAVHRSHAIILRNLVEIHWGRGWGRGRGRGGPHS